MSTRRRQRGFTLVEVIASMVVLSVLGSVTASILLSSADSYLDATSHAQLHLDASVGLDRIVREFRRIPPDPDGGAGAAISNMTANSIEWVDASGEASSLILTDTDLFMQVGGAAPALLIGDVTGFTLSAFDEDDSPIALPATGVECLPIRRIQIQVTTSQSGQAETLRTRVFLRNTMRTSP